MMELLVVMGIIAVLLGISVGMFDRIDRGRTLRSASVLLKTAVRTVRNSARDRGAPAVLEVDPGANTIRTFAAETAGLWHFEDSGGARGTDVSGAEIVDGGILRRCARLSGGSIDCGAWPFYEAERGFTFSLWIRPFREASGLFAGGEVASRGRAFRLSVGSGGEVTADVGLGPQGVAETLSTPPGAVVPERWTHLALSYDRRAIRILVDHVERTRRAAEAPPASAKGAGLRIGGGQRGLQALVDEAVFLVLREGDTLRIQDPASLVPGPVRLIYFDEQGRLDIVAHPRPAEIVLQSRKETLTLGIGRTGSVRETMGRAPEPAAGASTPEEGGGDVPR